MDLIQALNTQYLQRGDVEVYLDATGPDGRLGDGIYTVGAVSYDVFYEDEGPIVTIEADGKVD